MPRGMSSLNLGLLFLFWLLGFALLWKIPYPRKSDEEGLLAGKVSIIIPARDEEGNLVHLFRSLESQGVKPREVIVVDDHSLDATAEVARRAGCRVIPSEDLPEGWTGKPWACWQGARAARGDLFLFLDADTFLERDGLEKLVSTYRKGKGLLTVQPYHRMERTYERLSAFFNLIILAGMISFRSRWARGRATGAFGPCNLCSREDYFASGGHARVKGEILESLGLAEAFRKIHLPVRCYGGKGTISFRMYPGGVRSLIEGFSKGFGSGAQTISRVALVAVVCWVTAGTAVVRHLLEAMILGDFLRLLQAGFLYLLFALQIHWMLRRTGNYGILPAFLFPLPLLFFVIVFFLSFVRIFLRGRVRWKGREVKTSQKKG